MEDLILHFTDEFVHLRGEAIYFLFTFRKSKPGIHMDNYFITIGMYLILMLFFKIYFAVAKD